MHSGSSFTRSSWFLCIRQECSICIPGTMNHCTVLPMRITEYSTTVVKDLGKEKPVCGGRCHQIWKAPENVYLLREIPAFLVYLSQCRLFSFCLTLWWIFYEHRSALSSLNSKIIFSATMKWGPPQSAELLQQLVAYWQFMKLMRKIQGWLRGRNWKRVSLAYESFVFTEEHSYSR